MECLNLYNKLFFVEDFVKFSEMFKNILEPSKAYYRLNNLDDDDEMPV